MLDAMPTEFWDRKATAFLSQRARAVIGLSPNPQ